jgi:AraC-like DNA-binding protein
VRCRHANKQTAIFYKQLAFDSVHTGSGLLAVKSHPQSELPGSTQCCAGRARGEQGQIFRWPDLPGVELLTADFKHHSYVPHWHDAFMVGLVAAGCERVQLAGTEHHLAPGDVVLLNPAEIHDGEAFDTNIGWDFRVFYLAAEVLEEAAEDLRGAGNLKGIFEESIITDPAMWRSLLNLHATLSRSDSLLERSSSLFTGLTRLMSRSSSDGRELKAMIAPLSLERAHEYLQASWAKAVSLDELAEVAGLSRFHLLREFRKRYGLPPHAYQLQLRILRAKEMLFLGVPPGEVALKVGFYDQAHFTHALKRYVGVSPGRIFEYSVLSSGT